MVILKVNFQFKVVGIAFLALPKLYMVTTVTKALIQVTGIGAQKFTSSGGAYLSYSFTVSHSRNKCLIFHRLKISNVAK